MKRVKSKEWKKLKQEGVSPPWIPHFPKILLILKTLDTKSHFQRKNNQLLQLRRKITNRNVNKTIEKTIENPTKTKVKNLKRNIREVKNNIIISLPKMEVVKLMKLKKMLIPIMRNLVGTLKKPTSTNKIKITMVKLKISISKRIKEAKMEKRNSIRKILKRMETISKIRKSHSSQEKIILKKTKSKMTKTPTVNPRKESIKNILISNMINADLKGLTITKLLKGVETIIEDLKEVAWTTMKVVEVATKDTNGIISNHTLIGAMMISM
jgi:hypothetical protein